MGNIWDCLLRVNALQLVPSQGRSQINLYTRKRGQSSQTLPPQATLSPLLKQHIHGVHDAILVSWDNEDGDLETAWVQPGDVVPSLYSATSGVDIKEYPDGPSAGRVNEGELFAAARNLQDENGVWWSELSDGRGYIAKTGEGYDGPPEVMSSAPVP